MKSIFFISALLNINFVNAQQPTPVIKTDTTVQRTKLKPFTGFEMIKEKKRSIESLFIPAVLITYGFVALGNNGLKKLDNNTKLEIREDHPTFITKLDNYLQYSPALAVYGLNALGVKGKNNFRDRTIIYGLSTIISSAIVLPLKKITKV